MRKSHRLIIALVIVGLAVLAGPGCKPEFSVPGGGTWGTRVTITVGGTAGSSAIIAWSGRLLNRHVVTGTSQIDWTTTASGGTGGSAVSIPYTVDVPGEGAAEDDFLTPGVWRFETKITVGGERRTIVCDLDVPSSGQGDLITVILTVTVGGCSADGLRAASIVTDFSEYATGQQPSGWTPFGATANSTWTVQGGELHNNQTVNGLSGMSWTAVPPQADVEVLAKVWTNNIDTQLPSPVLFARGITEPGSAEGYAVGLRGGTQLVFYKVQAAGTLQNIPEQPYSFPYTANRWYWIRFKVHGTAPAVVTIRVWADGDVEPNNDYPIADPGTAITGPGEVGVLTLDANADPRVGLFSVSVFAAGEVGELTYAAPFLAQTTCTNGTGFFCPP